jgi:hypothetical protein
MPFFLCDGVAASHVFDVRDSNVGNDRDIGSRERSQRCDFTRVIHARFRKRHLVARPQSQHRQRKADVIVQVPLGP